MKDIRIQWKALASAKQITSEDIAALCLYKAMFKEEHTPGAKARLHKSFSPITNSTKLNNGAQPWMSLEQSLRTIKYSAVAKWLEPEDLAKLLEFAKETLQAGIK